MISMLKGVLFFFSLLYILLVDFGQSQVTGKIIAGLPKSPLNLQISVWEKMEGRLLPTIGEFQNKIYKKQWLPSYFDDWLPVKVRRNAQPAVSTCDWA
jgi:hypothetical protein